MRGFQSAYIGRHEFPKRLAEFELRQWFTFDARVKHEIRKSFRSRYWMGAALQLGFVRMTGTTLDSLEYVPPSLLRHLGRQFVQRALDLATLRSLYRRTQTRYRHQSWAMQYRGLRELGERGQQLLEEYVRERTHATLSRGRLEQLAREWLFNAFFVMPGRRVISDLVRSVTRAVMLEDHGALRQRNVAAPMQSCLQALSQQRPSGTMDSSGMAATAATTTVYENRPGAAGQVPVAKAAHRVLLPTADREGTPARVRAPHAPSPGRSHRCSYHLFARNSKRSVLLP